MDLQAFITALKTYIARQETNPQCDESLLEILFDIYAEFSGFDNDTILEDFNALYAVMNSKTIREMDEIIYPACTLFRDHEKVEFQERVKEEIRLEREINIT